MTEKEIRSLLEQGYDRGRWKELATAILPGRDLFKTELRNEPATAADRKLVRAVVQFGEAKLKDGQLIGLYEVELLPTVDASRNRVSIRKAVESQVKWGGLSGALISFHAPGSAIWRFSYYSNVLGEDGKWESANRKRYTYLLGEGEKCRTAAEQFHALAKNEGQVTLEDLKEAFSVEKVSKAFFREYKEHYQNFVEHLTGKRMVKKQGKWVEEKTGAPSPKLAYVFNGNEKGARDFCKKLMGRLVFLYFLQKKRWLGATSEKYDDGDLDFVGHLFRDRGEKDFYQHILVGLFFDTLNRERVSDEYAMPDGRKRKVPFLNGGLFDKESLDAQSIKHMLTFPSKFFSNPAKIDEEKERGFLDFLNAYNFTVHEAGPEEQTLAVDPEMLGHIFENLLEDNKDKGAFYTPKEIVHYMCQESLTQYLKNYVTKAFGTEAVEAQLDQIRTTRKDSTVDLEGLVRDLIREQVWSDLESWCAPELIRALRDVKVCDPAIGSGAFPMGMLHEIHQVANTIQNLRMDEVPQVWGLENWEPAEVKLHIIQHSIYGVDIERGAVDIARLRFWLSIIVDEPKPRTLPNLDYKIVVGDSLLGKFNGEVLEIDWNVQGGTDRLNEIRALIEELGRKTEKFFLDPDEDKKKLAAQVRVLKVQLITKQLELTRDKFKAHMLPTARIGELTKKEMVRAAEEKIQLGAYEAALSKLKPLAKEKDATLDYFDWQLDFPEVLNPNVAKDPGFDVVIGNPPYVRLQTLIDVDPTLPAHLKNQYRAAGKGNYDLYVLFIEQGVRLLRKDGELAFIQPHKFFNAQYGEPLRALISEGKYLRHVVHFGSEQIFPGASTYVCLLFLSRHGAEECRFSSVSNFPSWLESRTASSSLIPSATIGSREWNFVTGDDVPVFDQLMSSHRKLGDIANLFVGLQTSADTVFLFKDKVTFDGLVARVVSKELGEEVEIERSLLKRVVRSAEIGRYWSSPTAYVLFPYHLVKGRSVLIPESEMKKYYPKAWAYLKRNKKLLEGREHGRFAATGWWQLYPKNLDNWEQPKVMVPYMIPRLSAYLDTSGLYFVNVTTGGFGLTIKSSETYTLKFITGLLNSTVLDWVLKRVSSTFQGGYFAANKQYMVQLPVPRVSQVGQVRVVTLVEKRIRIVDKTMATAIEREIDVLVCKLYGLSWQQAKVVDPSLALSEAEYDAIELPEQDGPPSSMVSEPGVTGLTDEGTLFGQPMEPEAAKPPQPKKPQAPKDPPANINDTTREEVLQAIRKLFGTGSRDRETALRDLAKAMGYQRLGTQIHKALSNELLTAVRRGILINEGGQYSLLARSLEDYDRAYLKQVFLSANTTAWTARTDAIRNLTRWLGYTRTSEAMMDVGRSLINGLLRTGELEKEGTEMIRKR